MDECKPLVTNLKYDQLLSSFAFDFNLRPYHKSQKKDQKNQYILSYVFTFDRADEPCKARYHPDAY